MSSDVHKITQMQNCINVLVRCKMQRSNALISTNAGGHLVASSVLDCEDASADDLVQQGVVSLQLREARVHEVHISASRDRIDGHRDVLPDHRRNHVRLVGCLLGISERALQFSVTVSRKSFDFHGLVDDGEECSRYCCVRGAGFGRVGGGFRKLHKS